MAASLVWGSGLFCMPSMALISPFEFYFVLNLHIFTCFRLMMMPMTGLILEVLR